RLPGQTSKGETALPIPFHLRKSAPSADQIISRQGGRQMTVVRTSAAPVERLDARANLRICWLFIRRSLRLWTYFKLNFLIGQAEVVSNLIIFATIARFHT